MRGGCSRRPNQTVRGSCAAIRESAVAERTPAVPTKWRVMWLRSARSRRARRRSRSTLLAMVICMAVARFRWCVSGEPVAGSRPHAIAAARAKMQPFGRGIPASAGFSGRLIAARAELSAPSSSAQQRAATAPRPAHRGTYSAARCSRTIELSAVDRDLECLADLSHPHAAQCTDPFDQYGG